jgi:dinuclear metal center YbgI/SA1388 family protein
MIVHEITSCLEKWAPLPYAEDYDNVGLLVGDFDQNVSKVLITHDALESVIEEAIKKSCELIICFHPIIFKGLKRLTKESYVSRSVSKAIKNNISIYAMHTALDMQLTGVNSAFANLLNLKNREVLIPAKGTIQKLITYVPEKHINEVQKALFNVGGGAIGHYDQCSFLTEGLGSYRPLKGSNPYMGEINKQHMCNESQLQMVFPKNLKKKIIETLKYIHPYETVAYEIQTLNNTREDIGIGCVGKLPNVLNENQFLKLLKKTIGTPTIRHSEILGNKIEQVALIGGSGSFAIERALAKKVDAFITSDLKYHDFFKAESQFLLIDVGHYESEQFTKKIIIKYLTENFPNFVFISSETNTNPVYYF